MNKVYGIYLKSHCEAPDYEAQIEAQNKRQASRIFYQMLKGEMDYKTIYENTAELSE